MKKAVTTIVLTCDICGTQKNVKSYDFMSKRLSVNEAYTVESIELCSDCQAKVFTKFKQIVKENALYEQPTPPNVSVRLL